MNWLRLTTLVLVLSVFTHGIFGQVVQPSSNQNTKNSAITTKKNASAPKPSTKILTRSDRFLALINYVRNYPGRVSKLLRKHEMDLLCKYFKKKSCTLLSFDLTHFRQVPKFWPSADLMRLTEKFVKNNVKHKKITQKEVQGFLKKTKKDLNFEEMDGDCFSYKELRFEDIQRVFSMILNKPEYKYYHNSSVISTTFKKISQLILPDKYRSIYKQKVYGRKLQVLENPKESDHDRLTAGFNIIHHRSNFYGCLMIGKLKMTGASKVKSPYNKAKIEALDQYMKETRLKFDNAFTSKKQHMKLLLQQQFNQRAAMFKNLQKQAHIEHGKRPKDQTGVMRGRYQRLVRKVKIHKPHIKELRTKYLALLARLKQLRKQKLLNKTYFRDLAKSKKLNIELNTQVKLFEHLVAKMKFIKEKYLQKPKNKTMKEIPPYFTNMNVAVTNKKSVKLSRLIYNITVVPNWASYLRNIIHDYGKEYTTTVNEYITTRAAWKKNKTLAIKAQQDSDVLARNYYFLVANANFKLQQLAAYSKAILKNARKYLSACSIGAVVASRVMKSHYKAIRKTKRIMHTIKRTKDAKKLKELKTTLKKYENHYKKSLASIDTETKMLRKRQHDVRSFIKLMKKRKLLLKNIKSLSRHLGRQGKQLLELSKAHRKKDLVKVKNAIQMIKKNLYWNYYYLNISNTDLNVKFRELPKIKQWMNKTRNYSHTKFGIAKIDVMDLKYQLKKDISDKEDQKEQYFKQMLAIKNKKAKKSVASFVRHKNYIDPKVLELQKKYDAIGAEIKKMKNSMTKAFFKAKKIVEGFKKKKNFKKKNINRKASCFHKVQNYKKQFIPREVKALNLKLELAKAIKNGVVSLEEIRKKKKSYRRAKFSAFYKYAKAKACSTTVKFQHAVLNDLDLKKPCENHTTKQCQDNIKAKIKVVEKKVMAYWAIWGDVKGKYTDRNVKAMIKVIYYKDILQKLNWNYDECEDSKCDNKKAGADLSGVVKPKIVIKKCHKGFVRINGKCTSKPKCVPMSKKTCQAKKAEEIKDTQDQIQKLTSEIDTLKKDKQMAKKLKDAQNKLSKLILKSKTLVQKAKKCKEVKCPDAIKDIVKPKGECKSESKKACQAKYMSLVKNTKAKLHLTQENKRKFETDLVPNKAAADKEGKEIVVLQALLKKYLIAFRHCKDTRCPGDKPKKPKDDLVEAYKVKLIAEYKYKQSTEVLTEYTTTSVETTIEETTITSTTEVVSLMETTVVETTQEITIVEEQIVIELKAGNTKKAEKLKEKAHKKKKHLEKHTKKLNHAKKNHAKVLAKVAEHKQFTSQVIEITEEITIIETHIETIKDDPKQLMDLHKQLAEKKKHKHEKIKEKKRAFGHLKSHHKKFAAQAKSEKVSKISYSQETQITEIIEIHEEVIETTEIQIIEFTKQGDTTKVEELEKKLDEHKQLHKDAHKKIKHLKHDTRKKKKQIVNPKVTKIHEVAKANVRKLKHLEKKKDQHKKAKKRLAAHKHLLKRATVLKDAKMIKYYTEQVTETTATVEEITESITTVETTIETITSNVETTTVKSATSTLRSELIPAFHAKMSIEISLRNAHKASNEASANLEKIKKDPRAKKLDIARAEIDVKEASKKVVENREARQGIFAHLSKTHKKVMAHKTDHDIKKHLKNLSKHMQEKAHAETKLDHHKKELHSAKKELLKAKVSGNNNLIEHWSTVVSETTVVVEEVTTVVVEYQETIITQIDHVERTHNLAKSQHVKLAAEDKRQLVNNLKLNVNAAKVKALAIKMKLAQAKKDHKDASRRLGKSNPSTEATVTTLEIEVKLHDQQVKHYESQVTVETEELVTVTEEETIEVTRVANSSIKNTNSMIKQIKSTIKNCHTDIAKAHSDIAKHKKALKDASKKNDETTKLRIQLSIDKLESKLPKLHDKITHQQKKAFKHIANKNKHMVKKHKQNVKNAKKTIQAAKDKHKLLAKSVQKKKEEYRLKADKDPQAAFIIQQEIDTVTVEITQTVTVIEKHTKLIDLSFSTQFSIQSKKYAEYKKVQLEVAKSAKHKKETLEKLVTKGKADLKVLIFQKKDKKAASILVKKLKAYKKQKDLTNKRLKHANKKAGVCHNKAKLMKIKAVVKLAQHKKDAAHNKEEDDATIEEIKLKMKTANMRKKNYLRWQWITITNRKKNNDKIRKEMSKKIAKVTKKLNRIKDKVNKKSLASQSGCAKIVGKAKQLSGKLLNSHKLDQKKAKAKKNQKGLTEAKKLILRAERIKHKMLKVAKKQSKKCEKKHQKTMKIQIKKLKKEKSKSHKNLNTITYEIRKLQAKLNGKLSKAEELKIQVEIRSKLSDKSRITLEITTIETDIFERLPTIQQTVISNLHQDVFYKANFSLAKQAHLEIIQSTNIIVQYTYEITTIETEIVTITKSTESEEIKKAKISKLKAKKAKHHAKVKKAKKVKAKAHAKKNIALKRNKHMVAKKLSKAKKVHSIAKKHAKKAAKKHIRKIKKVKKQIKKLLKKIKSDPVIKKKTILQKRLAAVKRNAKKVLKDHKKITKKTKKAVTKAKLKAITRPKVTHHKLKKAIKGLKPHRAHQIVKKAQDQAIAYTAIVSEEITVTIEVTQETVAEIQHTEVLHSSVVEEIQVVETMIVTAETTGDHKKVAALKQRLTWNQKKMHKHKKAIKHLKKKHAALSHKTKKLNLHKAKSMKKIANMSSLKIKAVKGMKKLAIKKKIKSKKQLHKQKKALKKFKVALKKATGAAIKTIKAQIVQVQTTVETITETVETYSSEITTSSLTISTETSDSRTLHRQVSAQIKEFSSGKKDYMAATESQLVSSSTTTSIETTVLETTTTMESIEERTKSVSSSRLLDEIKPKTRKLTISKVRRDMIATLLGVDLEKNVRKLELNVEN